MRALIHSEFGDPAQVLSVEELPVPEPGPREVRIRVILATIHNHDLWTVRGTYGYKPQLPARAGTEAVGIVDAVGPEVEGIEVGQRVATGGTFGTWAEYVIAKAGAVVPVPDSIPDEIAAQLIAMPFSAITLVDFLGVESGDVVLQNTANGTVGRLVAQIGASRGITVIGIVRRASDVDELASAGISNIVSTDDDGWKDRVRELAGDRPIRAAVDSVGGSAAGDLLHLLGDGGTLVSFGAMASDRMQLSSGDLIFKQAVVKGFWGSKVSAAMPGDTQRALFGELFQLVGSGRLTLPVDSIHPLDDIAGAVAASTRQGRVGKVLLRP
ncbi:zinc-binding dehydrogenase [Microbacterium rhizosphaerae]|uniref:enoyl-[acyl-carrier-protein] reductase n=1 Tax=Microbacterium rhizosphaerae TaxID=1678237 RepID=A0ABZ0SQP8_9MICO|nr:zinc-binding dehydrogenase [Microbacterium rhizosphaerae]WPR90002.1 zinc-binding dehydrogenase [Microbacterium rhizosphaerae]